MQPLDAHLAATHAPDLSTYTPFKIYLSAEQAEDTVFVLRKNGVDCEIEYPRTRFSAINQGDGSTGVYRVMLRSDTDMPAARTALLAANEAAILHLPKDYYLFQFTNEKLYNVLVEGDEWGELDQFLAEKLLIERGVTIDKTALASAQAARETEPTERISTAMLMSSVILCLFCGFIPLIMGLNYYFSTKQAKNGGSYYTYDAYSRKMGLIMAAISSCVVGVFWYAFW
jgi:uncharacterized membrane protein YidH (DUF202 family)